MEKMVVSLSKSARVTFEVMVDQLIAGYTRRMYVPEAKPWYQNYAPTPKWEMLVVNDEDGTPMFYTLYAPDSIILNESGITLSAIASRTRDGRVRGESGRANLRREFDSPMWVMSFEPR